MAEIITQRRRRFRANADNPYKTRALIYKLISTRPMYTLCVTQEDYVLRSVVAVDNIELEGIGNSTSGRQLIDHMFRLARSIDEVADMFRDWQKGELLLKSYGQNLLVKKAIRKRFARNLKKM